MARGFTAVEQGHVVTLLTPQDVAAATSSEVIAMTDWQHCTILIAKGAGSACTIQVEECDNFTPTTAATKAFRYAVEATASGDVLDAALATAGTAGVSTDTDTGTMMVIEIDADELSDGYPNIRIKCDAVGTALMSWMAILSGGRYQKSITATAIV